MQKNQEEIERDRNSVNVMIDKRMIDEIEGLRIQNAGDTTIRISRSDLYNIIVALGLPIYKWKTELGDNEFYRIWNIFQKLDLKKFDITKIM